MRLENLPETEFKRRIFDVQQEMKNNDLDLLITYSSETESASSRYLANFWPFFDFVGIIIPVEGEPALITGGPESFDFAQEFSVIKNIYIHPLFVETSAPEWVPKVEGETFENIIPKICKTKPKKVGIADWNIFPHLIWDDLRIALPDASFIRADDILIKVRSTKNEVEIPYIKKAYEIVEKAMSYTLNKAREGLAEYELESIARKKMLELGAEGMPYPSWVCSGPNTVLSLCRSTNRQIEKGDLVQFTFGSKYNGYCGNMCRPFVLGNVADNVKKLMDAALESTEYAISTIKPGITASDIFMGYYKILKNYGYEEFTLYGPAHGTGYSEVDGLWLSKNAKFIIKPNMLFNIDIWLTDGEYGIRFEEGVLTTESGLCELNGSYREIINL